MQNIEIVKSLLKSGVNVETRDKNGKTGNEYLSEQ